MNRPRPNDHPGERPAFTRGCGAVVPPADSPPRTRIVRGALRFAGGCAVLLLAAAGTAAAAETLKSNGPDLTEMSVEQLMNLEVTSVAKKAEKLSETPAAITVITQDDIRRSGVTSLPEALRMAPGLEVARVDAHEWAISARGFNDVFANKLLVMIDGRSVYTPLFSGVFWDVQDTVLEDVDRIEVIRGPGATVWGANAVDGVINIITKSAKETQGTLITGGAGSEERGFGAVRYGGKLGDNAYFRVYGKYFNRDDSVLPSGANARDAWQQGRWGFRADWDISDRNTLTLQGDAYAGLANQTLVTYDPTKPPGYSQVQQNDFSVNGGNVLGRWTHTIAEDSNLQLQFYYDRTERHTVIFRENRDTYDVDLQHRLPLGARNDVVWGLGYRATADQVGNSPSVTLHPDHRTDQLVSAFVQDELTLVPNRLRLTLGSKFEHNDYTGFEVEPGARLAWTPQERQMIWGSISRAVRTPSRAEDDIKLNSVSPGSLFAPTVVTSIYGNRNFQSEDLIAYELGYRAQPLERVSFDVALFYNVYDHLRSVEFGPSPTQPITAPPPPPPPPLPPAAFAVATHIENQLDGDTYGVEFGPTWRVTDWWRLRPSYTFLHMRLFKDPGSTDAGSTAQQGWSPQHQFSLYSSMDLPRNVSVDVDVRYVDRLPALNIGSYVVMDVRLGWRPTRNLEFAVVGQNLLHNQHQEFAPSFITTQTTEVQQSIYASVTWRF